MSNDQDRIAQLEAACALKDKVINDVRFFLQDYLKSVTHPGVSRLVGDCYDATTTTAGKDLLNRLQAVEKERDRAIELLRSSDDDAVSVFLETIQKS